MFMCLMKKCICSKYRFLIRKPEGEKQLGRPRHRCKDDIKMDLQEVGWWEVWTGLVWLRRRTSDRLL
jgi:hypothetical protein